MRKLFISIVAVLACLGVVSAAEEYPLRDAVEVTVRDGLPNFYKKLNEGKDVTIAYLGGSITAQPGYRVKSEKWFQEKFPKAKVKGVHAAIGGTGSDLGAYRLQQDALFAKPDLLFVEFAVNDNGKRPEQIIKYMEGIVRQTIKDNPETDICFVYTFMASNLKTLQSGKYQRSASAMEEVADHYGIPSIHMGLKATQLIKEGKVIMKAPKAKVEEVADGALNDLKSGKIAQNGEPIPFSKDGTHPYVDTGHQLYMNAIERSMEKIEKAGTPGARKLVKPLDPNNAERGKIVPFAQSMLSGGDWRELKKGDKDQNSRFLNRFKTMWVDTKPGGKLSFKFKGTYCAIYDLKGPAGAKVAVKLDGKPAKNNDRFDHYCTYYRINTLPIGYNLSDTVHTVEIEVLAEQPDRAGIFQKGSKTNYAKMQKNPEQYDGTNWYVGGIILEGDLVE